MSHRWRALLWHRYSTHMIVSVQHTSHYDWLFVLSVKTWMNKTYQLSIDHIFCQGSDFALYIIVLSASPMWYFAFHLFSFSLFLHDMLQWSGLLKYSEINLFNFISSSQEKKSGRALQTLCLCSPDQERVSKSNLGFYDSTLDYSIENLNQTIDIFSTQP